MPKPTKSVRILLTVSEAYPALERAFLGATSEIWASFPVFNLATRLRSPEALAIGKTWFDLVVHTLNRRVSVHFLIGDVDPIARPAMHQAATRNLRMFSAAAAVANPGVRLEVMRPLHPAKSGALIRLAIWPFIMKHLFRTAGWLNSLSAAHRTAALRNMDGLASNLRVRPDGTVAVRIFALPRLCPVVHHQKLAVVDRRVLYIGDLDLDERCDETPTHQQPGDGTWHDLQLMIEGPVVAEAQQHLESFCAVIDGRIAPPKTRRLLRTLSRPLHGGLWNFGPQLLVSELRTAHLVLARRATNLIYMESQSFRDVDLAKAISDMARRTPDLGMILILPATPNDVAFEGRRGLESRMGEAMQARVLRILRKGFGARLFVGSPAQPRRVPPDGNGDRGAGLDRLHGAALICAHSKVSVFDDAAAVVSSASLDGRSLRWDTEAGVYLTDENDVTELRHRVMTHWLPKDAPPEAFEAATAVRAWARIALRNATRPSAQREGRLLPHDFAAAEAFGRKLPHLPPEFV